MGGGGSRYVLARIKFISDMRTSKAYAISLFNELGETQVICTCDGKESVLNHVLNQLANEYGARDYYEEKYPTYSDIVFITAKDDITLRVEPVEYYSLF